MYNFRLNPIGAIFYLSIIMMGCQDADYSAANTQSTPVLGANSNSSNAAPNVSSATPTKKSTTSKSTPASTSPSQGNVVEEAQETPIIPPPAPLDFAVENPKDMFTFVLFSEAHQDVESKPWNNQTILPKLVAQFNQLKPDLVVSVGDNVAKGNRKEDWDIFKNRMSKLNLKKPKGLPSVHMPAIGDHEYCLKIYPDLHDEQACRYYRENYEFLETLQARSGLSENYYMFSYGKNLFIMDHLDQDDKHSQWYQSIKNHIRSSNYNNVFMLRHWSPYFAKTKSCGKPWRGMRNIFNDYIYTPGKNHFYFGGNEDYVFSFFDCEAGDGGCKKTKYISAPGAGGDLSKASPSEYAACSAAEYDNDVRVRKIMGSFGFLRFAVHQKDIRMTYFDENAKVKYEAYFSNELYTVNDTLTKKFACNFNNVCEAPSGENAYNCPSDCNSQ